MCVFVWEGTVREQPNKFDANSCLLQHVETSHDVGEVCDVVTLPGRVAQYSCPNYVARAHPSRLRAGLCSAADVDKI